MLNSFSKKQKYIALGIVFLWTVIVSASALWNSLMYNNIVVQNAKADAESSYNKDLLYRRWFALQGGVYVTPSEKTPPNSYLSNIPDRDIVTTDKKKLTLINPAYMTRQVHELSDLQYGTKGHITSLKPLNPINTPDNWEVSALKKFEEGIKEVSSIENIGGQSFLRYMKPMITEGGCLKCHEWQGYKIGEIRGGISVTVPLENYSRLAESNKKNMVLIHLGIYLAGALSLLFFLVVIKKNMIERGRHNNELKQSRERLISQKNVLDAIFENSPYIMVLVDEAINVVNVNRPGVLFSGKSKEELNGELAGIALNCINSFKEPGCGKHPECCKCPIRSSITDAFRTGNSLHNSEASMTFLINRQTITCDILISTSLLLLEDQKVVLVTLADITAQKQSEKLINESKNRFKSIFDLSPYAIVLTDIEDGYYLDINKAFESFAGFTRDEIIGASVNELSFWSSNEERTKWSSDLQLNGEIKNAEFDFINKNGKKIIGELSSKIIELSGKKTILSMIQDITEKKKDEEIISLATEELKLAQKISQIGSWSWKLSENRVQWTDEMYSIFGISRTGFSGSIDEIVENAIHPDDKQKVINWNYSVFKGIRPEALEFRIIRHDGDIRAVWGEPGKIITDNEGIVIYATGTIQDITAHKEVESELVKYEQRMSVFIKNNPLAVIEWDPELKIKEWNLAAEHIFGYTKTEVLGKTWQFIVPELLQEEMGAVFNGLISKTGGKRNTNYNYTKDGRTILCNWYNTSLTDIEGKVTGIISLGHDITEEVSNEEELLKNRNMLQSILNSIPQSIFWKDRNSVYLGCNKNFAESVGLSSTDEIIDKIDFDLPWPQNEAASYIADDQEVILKKIVKSHIVEPLQQADGNRLWIDTTKLPLTDINGNVYGVLGVFEDITKRKEAESQQNLLIETLNASSNELYIFDSASLLFEFVSKGALDNLGYSINEIRQMTPLDLKPEYTAELFAMLIEPLVQGKTSIIHFETVHKRKNGSLYPVETNLQLYNRDNKKVFLAVVLDVTQRKKAAENLIKSEERFYKIFQSNPAAISILRLPDLKIIDVNKSYTEIFGYKKEEIIGRDPFELGMFVNINDHFEIAKYFNSNSRIPILELKLRNKNRKVMHILVATELAEINGERCVVSLMTDITERKIAEEKIKASEEKYRTLFETMAQGIVYHDAEGNIISANKAAENILGLASDQMAGRTSLDGSWRTIHEDGSNFHGEEHPVSVSLHTGLPVNDVTMGVFNPNDGKYRWIVVNATPQFRNNETKPYQVYASFTDITDRKLAEEALRNSEKRFSTIFYKNPVNLTIVRLRDMKLVEVNNSWQVTTGYNSTEAINKSTTDLNLWADSECRSLYLDELKKTGSVRNFNFNMRRRSGEILNMLISSETIELNGEKCILSIAYDITESIKIEKAMNENRDKIIAILKAIPDLMFILSKEGKFLDYHTSGENELYVESELFLNKTLYDILPQNIADLTMRKIDEIITTGMMQSFEYTLEFHGLKNYESRIVPCGRDSFLAIVRDVTKNKHDEMELKKSLDEKDTLLRELYHRTKNNMQVISAMLQLQTVSMTDPELIKILIETSNRIRTMSLVHQKLYQSKDLSQINLKEYITELINLLSELFNIQSDKIAISFDLEDQYILIDYAVPCGLVINEIASNTFKYAFPGELKGEFFIKLHRETNGAIVMIFSDNGVGLSKNFNINDTNTLGMQLIHTLVEHQLDGKLEIFSDKGVTIKITFFDNQYGIRI